MKLLVRSFAVALGGALCLLPASVRAESFLLKLNGFQEVPTVSTLADGFFNARIKANAIEYDLAYLNTTGDVLQAHIHIGQRGVNGGISVFLCQTEANPDPTGLAPTCAPAPAIVSGRLTANNVIGPSGQGVDPEEFDELVRAIRNGVAYVNVHTTTFPGGEVRGQTRVLGTP